MVDAVAKTAAQTPPPELRFCRVLPHREGLQTTWAVSLRARSRTSFNELRSGCYGGLSQFAVSLSLYPPHITLLSKVDKVMAKELAEKVRKARLDNLLTFQDISIYQRREGGEWKSIAHCCFQGSC